MSTESPPNTDANEVALPALVVAGKAHIVTVGEIVNGQPRGFCFDCAGLVPAIDISDEPKWAGWTLAELREVIARPDEFCDNASVEQPGPTNHP